MTTFLILVGCLLAEMLFMAFLLRVRKGTFQQEDDGASGKAALTWFETDLGRYQIDRKRGVFRSLGKSGRTESIPLRQVEGISIKRHEQADLLLETLTGFDVFDLFKRYRDTVEWYTVSIHPTDRLPVPIFVAGRYVPREFFLEQFIINAQLWLFETCHLTRDVGDVSREAMGKVRAAFAGAGVQLSVAS